MWRIIHIPTAHYSMLGGKIEQYGDEELCQSMLIDIPWEFVWFSNDGFHLCCVEPIGVYKFQKFNIHEFEVVEADDV